MSDNQLPKAHPMLNENEIIPSWTISDTTPIPPIPLLYPIEKTNVILKDTKASTIVSRISTFLKSNSICYVVDANPCIVKCQTFNHVHFMIRLYSSKCDLLVEIQRVSGCAITFHSTSKNVLSAAKGDDRPLTKHSRPKLSRGPAKMNISNQERIQESLEIVNSLLKKDRIDANLLGIESLHMLTNPDISGIESAVVAAKVVLYGADDGIMDKIHSLIEHWRLLDDDEDDALEDIFDRKHYSKMRNYALGILGNSLEVLSSQGILQIAEDSWLATTFISTLISDLKESSSRPHDGALSAKCLHLLIRQSHVIRTRALECGAADVLYSTLIFSRCANDSLAKQSELVYMALNCK
jgi:hypothetical protein